MRYWFPILAILCVAGCGKKDTDAGPGGVSVGEARALDDAASMLDQQRLAPGALASERQAAQPGATASPTPSSAPAT